MRFKVPRITITVSELVINKLRDYVESAAGTTLSRAAADILADVLVDEDEVLQSQDSAWGGLRERIDDDNAHKDHP
jgi:hypothetical protein